MAMAEHAAAYPVASLHRLDPTHQSGLYAGACGDGAMADGSAATNGNASLQASAHVLCISSYPHNRKDRPSNPCLYWLGTYEDGGRFNLAEAHGISITSANPHKTVFHDHFSADMCGSTHWLAGRCDIMQSAMI